MQNTSSISQLILLEPNYLQRPPEQHHHIRTSFNSSQLQTVKMLFIKMLQSLLVLLLLVLAITDLFTAVNFFGALIFSFSLIISSLKYKLPRLQDDDPSSGHKANADNCNCPACRRSFLCKLVDYLKSKVQALGKSCDDMTAKIKFCNDRIRVLEEQLVKQAESQKAEKEKLNRAQLIIEKYQRGVLDSNRARKAKSVLERSKEGFTSLQKHKSELRSQIAELNSQLASHPVATDTTAKDGEITELESLCVKLLKKEAAKEEELKILEFENAKLLKDQKLDAQPLARAKDDSNKWKKAFEDLKADSYVQQTQYQVDSKAKQEKADEELRQKDAQIKELQTQNTSEETAPQSSEPVKEASRSSSAPTAPTSTVTSTNILSTSIPSTNAPRLIKTPRKLRFTPCTAPRRGFPLASNVSVDGVVTEAAVTNTSPASSPTRSVPQKGSTQAPQLQKAAVTRAHELTRTSPAAYVLSFKLPQSGPTSLDVPDVKPEFKEDVDKTVEIVAIEKPAADPQQPKALQEAESTGSVHYPVPGPSQPPSWAPVEQFTIPPHLVEEKPNGVQKSIEDLEISQRIASFHAQFAAESAAAAARAAQEQQVAAAQLALQQTPVSLEVRQLPSVEQCSVASRDGAAIKPSSKITFPGNVVKTSQSTGLLDGSDIPGLDLLPPQQTESSKDTSPSQDAVESEMDGVVTDQSSAPTHDDQPEEILVDTTESASSAAGDGQAQGTDLVALEPQDTDKMEVEEIDDDAAKNTEDMDIVDSDDDEVFEDVPRAGHFAAGSSINEPPSTPNTDVHNQSGVAPSTSSPQVPLLGATLTPPTSSNEFPKKESVNIPGLTSTSAEEEETPKSRTPQRQRSRPDEHSSKKTALSSADGGNVSGLEDEDESEGDLDMDIDENPDTIGDIKNIVIVVDTTRKDKPGFEKHPLKRDADRDEHGEGRQTGGTARRDPSHMLTPRLKGATLEREVLEASNAGSAYSRPPPYALLPLRIEYTRLQRLLELCERRRNNIAEDDVSDSLHMTIGIVKGQLTSIRRNIARQLVDINRASARQWTLGELTVNIGAIPDDCNLVVLARRANMLDVKTVVDLITVDWKKGTKQWWWE